MKINGVSVLNCLITIGDENPSNRQDIQNKIIINEVCNIEISDSYRTLINTCTVELTRQITIGTYVKNEYGEREEKLFGYENSIFKRGKRITRYYFDFIRGFC